jgi:hypothetical protein
MSKGAPFGNKNAKGKRKANMNIKSFRVLQSAKAKEGLKVLGKKPNQSPIPPLQINKPVMVNSKAYESGYKSGTAVATGAFGLYLYKSMKNKKVNKNGK